MNEGLLVLRNYLIRLRVIVWLTFRNLLSIRPAKRLTRGFLQQDETRGFLKAQTQGVFARCSLASGFHEVAVCSRPYAFPCRALPMVCSFSYRPKHKRFSSKAETQGVFSRPKHKVFSLAHRSQVVFTRLLCTTGFVKNRTTNASIRRTNRRLPKVNRVHLGRIHLPLLKASDTFVSVFGGTFTIAELWWAALVFSKSSNEVCLLFPKKRF